MKKRVSVKEDIDLILERLLIFDIWLLIKAQWISNQILKYLIPIIKVSLFMGFGAVLLLIYVFSNAKIDIGNEKEFEYKENNPLLTKYLQLDDNSKFQLVSPNKELLNIRNEMNYLEKQLYRMKLHLRSENEYKKNLDKNLADFASESVGGVVIDTPGANSFSVLKSTQMTLFGVPIWKPNFYTPRKVIQPWSQPGECWAFHGSQGKIEIELAHAITIESVTLEHIEASASLTGNINSAPKSFNILGKVKNQYVMIDTFMYKDKGPASQNFKIKKSEIKSIPFKRIILEILTNWGHPDYTCIYRLKVHGILYKPDDGEITFIQ